MGNNEIRGKFSEEEIWEAYQALNLGILGIEREKLPVALGILSDAISELIALRRRLADKDAIAEIIWEERTWGHSSHQATDAIIKYLTEPNDGK